MAKRVAGVEIRSGEPRRVGTVIFHAEIESRLRRKNALIEELLRVIRDEGFLGDPDDHLRARLCFDEALVNAIRHGNGQDASRHVRVTVSASAAKWNVLVEDEGSGFRPSDVPDPDDPESLLLERGRGILILRSYLTRATHYRGGSALLMEKYEKRRK